MKNKEITKICKEITGVALSEMQRFIDGHLHTTTEFEFDGAEGKISTTTINVPDLISATMKAVLKPNKSFEVQNVKDIEKDCSKMLTVKSNDLIFTVPIIFHVSNKMYATDEEFCKKLSNESTMKFIWSVWVNSYVAKIQQSEVEISSLR